MKTAQTWPADVNPDPHGDCMRPPSLASPYLTPFELAHELRIGGDARYWRKAINDGRVLAMTIGKRRVIQSGSLVDYLRSEKLRIPGGNVRAIKALMQASLVSPLLSASQLLAMKVRFEWIVKDWLPRRSIALMIGKPHEGKSYLALDLAIAVATPGQKFLKKTVTAHGSVMIVSTQDREPRLKQRLLRLCRGRGLTKKQATALPIYFHVPDRAPDLNDSADVEKLNEMIRSTHPVLVVLDLWTDFVGGKDENKPGVVGDATAPLREMKNELGCTFLAVCHTPKSQWHGGGDLTARGSGHLEGSADTKFTVKKKAASGQKSGHCALGIWCRDSSIGEKPPRYVQLQVSENEHGREVHRWRVVADEGKETKSRGEIRRSIVDAIRAFTVRSGQFPNTRELRSEARLQNKNAGKKLRDELTEIVKAGLIKEHQRGRKSLWEAL